MNEGAREANIELRHRELLSAFKESRNDDAVKDRRERIATAVLAGIAANTAYVDADVAADVRLAVTYADALIAELDKE